MIGCEARLQAPHTVILAAIHAHRCLYWRNESRYHSRALR